MEVDGDVDLHGVPQSLGDHGVGLGRELRQQLLDGEESALGHIVHVSDAAGAVDDVHLLTAEDHGADLGGILRRIHVVEVDGDVDLLLQIGVDRVEHGLLVGGRAGCHVPVQGDGLFSHRGRKAQHHHQSEQYAQDAGKFFHGYTSLLF